MTTLEKAIYNISKHKAISIFLFMVIALIFLSPLLLYFHQFHNNLSSQPEKWSFFGSFIGGIYGPIVTLISVFVLVITVIEINQSNKASINEARNTNYVSELITLSEILNRSIDNNIYIKNDRNYFFNNLNNIALNKIKSKPHVNSEVILKTCTRKFVENERVLFENEIDILHEIFSRIESIPNAELAERAKGIFRGVIRNNERFWIECYIRRFREDLVPHLLSWNTFSKTPLKLLSLIPEPSQEDGDKVAMEMADNG
ncbi:hypothetical protein TUM17563_13130 [Klebsiella oxytoca]|uniref:DUF4760 domain-containing protein n=1 Tax=Klebsiella michiganensis TaxID=1134687 RepID=A0AAX3CT00_9ENTR|nr:hypothetical protein [Klebsiella michiganensis]UWZ74830.1 hypothetical protein NP224_03495 [Klebsiella michiganensis]GJK63548.1 hypothetical protein TUM17563_13130 [Klebsiella oxytoca]